VEVLYLDYEMTLDDLQERMEAFGYGPESDLSHLHYASLPSLPPLDSPEGAKAVMELVEAVSAQVVVIDTFGRATVGEENDNDTTKSFYRWTGLALKAAGVAFLRTDHAGKDLTKGQRGGSAKNDDVDIVWQLIRVQDGVMLKATHRRMGWIPEHVQITVDDSQGWELSLTRAESFPEGTEEIARLLDQLGVPEDASFATANTAIKAADPEGKGRQKGKVLAAQRWRRGTVDVFINGSETVGTGSGNHFIHMPGNQTPEPQTLNGDLAGTEPVPEPVGTSSPGHWEPGSPPIGGTGTSPHPPEAEEDDVEVPF
jgi:hypothetical protein